MNIEQLKFPIGKYKSNKIPSEDKFNQWILTIDTFPSLVENHVKNLSSKKLKWKYRPEGWTIKQIIHHCADSHMNSLIRFKLALTEESPLIKPYFEDRWAELPDANNNHIEDSLSLLKGLHSRWAQLLNNLMPIDLEKEFVHPEHGKRYSLAEATGLYAWHCKHHLAHIKNAIQSEGKYNSN